jgi:hypothetical protein
MKGFIATKNFSDEEVTSVNLVKETTQAFKALMPLIKFINRSFE